MKRIRRTLLASIASIGMIASVALAGPGFNGYSGDPNEPHIIRPTGHGKVAEQDAAGSTVSGTSRTAVSKSTFEIEWKVVRIYLILQQTFSL